ncbi:hypothetical protein IC232_25420 [Microvirga sp. BT688]|uniref:hypothetical protein n=1 Tax=Microvirga sp. TaxID=1873136 RepID=UPI0016833A6C|nr:hypothetical protein [Microvirga sp.]MBD2750013.1 hypothetical protein [Microvirga sp.]
MFKHRDSTVIAIWVVCFLCFLISLATFFPGWMSNDSVDQYGQALLGAYSDWHPPLMAWWWKQLLKVNNGPAPLLVQNLLMYWCAWGLLATAVQTQQAERSIWVVLIPIVGLWPGLVFPLGQIWKDICFAVSLFLAWMIALQAHLRERRTSWAQRAVILALATFAVGVKPNGVVVLPFIFGYMALKEEWFGGAIFRSATAALFLSGGCFLGSAVPLLQSQVVKTHSFQYTQIHDLLAISVKTNQGLLPAYVMVEVNAAGHTLQQLYSPGSANGIFYSLGTPIRTTDAERLRDLNSRWLAAVANHPIEYLQHRWEYSKELMRIGKSAAAFVAAPMTVTNPYGHDFRPNVMSNILSSISEAMPWLYFPWIYALLLIGAWAVLLFARRLIAFAAALSASAVCFVAPHFVIGPASDFRYLYYAYLCSAILAVLAVSNAVKARRAITVSARYLPARQQTQLRTLGARHLERTGKRSLNQSA